MKPTGANIDSDDMFRSIYARYKPLLRVLAKRFGVPYDDTEDIVQDTFLAYYGHYPLTWEDYKMKAMLCRILKNRCVDYLRKRDSHPSTCWDPMKIQEEGELLNSLTGKDTLAILLEQEEYREVMEVLDSMKDDWAQVIYLYIIEGRPMEEVSRMLGSTDAACRTRLTRGRKYLRDKFKQRRAGDKP